MNTLFGVGSADLTIGTQKIYMQERNLHTHKHEHPLHTQCINTGNPNQEPGLNAALTALSAMANLPDNHNSSSAPAGNKPGLSAASASLGVLASTPCAGNYNTQGPGRGTRTNARHSYFIWRFVSLLLPLTAWVCWQALPTLGSVKRQSVLAGLYRNRQFTNE